ncbi:uncharacterized protein SCHCODRAFT_02210277 [Schizophyllum commune H4-8]|uniref:uncharacterized protein n=1 Tax=Schizophyllum commune (strain H4-8 / FGSC 9210) TaxID=578458 RepID=UPI00215F3F75|nr:uncharacterized protein SCHCODRAFT_02210277 [Schizophyllum commune H4-8]KAI5894490.1 hypothetical protein SCHCODRAFT_02210277 [Schizophyllum commune H4-8]
MWSYASTVYSMSPGMQLALATAAVSILLRRQQRSYRLIAAIVALILFSSLKTIGTILFYAVQIRANSSLAISPINLRVVDILLVVAARCSYVTDICVVVWRAWVLYADSRRIKAILALCVGAVVVCTIADFARITCKRVRGEEIDHQAAFTLIWAVPLLLTNIFTTALIGMRTWRYQREARIFLSRGSRRTGPGKVLVVLLETGLISCSLWMVYIILAAIDDPDTSTPGDVILQAYHSLSGIYPTVVILVVAMRRPETESFLEVEISRGLRFEGRVELATSFAWDPATTDSTAQDHTKTPIAQAHDATRGLLAHETGLHPSSGVAGPSSCGAHSGGWVLSEC